MKSREEFLTEQGYRDYLLTYLSAKALQGLLTSLGNGRDYFVNDKELDVEQIAKDSISCSKALLRALLPEKVLVQKDPKIEEKKPSVGMFKISVDAGNSLLKEKDYKSALVYFQEAIKLTDKEQVIEKLTEKVVLCEKWIKSLEDLKKVEQEKPFENLAKVVTENKKIEKLLDTDINNLFPTE